MKIIKKVVLAILYSFIVIVPCKSSYAMPGSRLRAVEYDYHDLSSAHCFRQAYNDLLNNRAVILFGSCRQRITIGNEKVAKKYASRGLSSTHLQLHHLFFRGIRTSFPAMPYLCMQATREHHELYHADRARTDIDFSTFTNMRDYLYDLRSSILLVSRRDGRNIYSNICIEASKIAADCQLYWIGQRFSWLHSVENGKYLLLAQRLLAKNCFPNQILSNISVCQSRSSDLSNQLALSHFVLDRIPSGSNQPGNHLAGLLQARIHALSTYVSQINPLTQSQALDMANYLYGDSERFRNPISHQTDLAGEFDGELSDAPSLND